jgi:hypothetical protein
MEIEPSLFFFNEEESLKDERDRVDGERDTSTMGFQGTLILRSEGMQNLLIRGILIFFDLTVLVKLGDKRLWF